MPETYGGYHFLIQDSDEINAFAAPGGLDFAKTHPSPTKHMAEI
jgi:hypothetical protein